MDFYFNDIGDENYSKAISDPVITERLIRGDLFALGRIDLSTVIEMELHPLIKANLTMIGNIADLSGIKPDYEKAQKNPEHSLVLQR